MLHVGPGVLMSQAEHMAKLMLDRGTLQQPGFHSATTTEGYCKCNFMPAATYHGTLISDTHGLVGGDVDVIQTAASTADVRPARFAVEHLYIVIVSDSSCNYP